MKTNLDIVITTKEEAVAFLTALDANGESFHPEDDAHDICWNKCYKPSEDDLDRLNELMFQCHLVCDPCENPFKSNL